MTEWVSKDELRKANNALIDTTNELGCANAMIAVYEAALNTIIDSPLIGCGDHMYAVAKIALERTKRGFYNTDFTKEEINKVAYEPRD